MLTAFELPAPLHGHRWSALCALRGEPAVALLPGLRSQPRGNDRAVLTGRLRLLANWTPRERGVAWDLQASEPCLQSARVVAGVKPQDTSVSRQARLRRPRAPSPNWGALTRGMLSWCSVVALPIYLRLGWPPNSNPVANSPSHPQRCCFGGRLHSGHSRQPVREEERLSPEGDWQTNTSCLVSTAAASAMLPSPAVSPRWTIMSRRALPAVPTSGQLAPP